MSTKIFISHCMQDIDLVKQSKSLLEANELDAYVAVTEPEPGRRIIEKIKENIRNSACFIVILTNNCKNSEWVQNEIGMAQSMGKTIIPIVEEGVNPPSIIQDIEYVKIDLNEPSKCIDVVCSHILDIQLTKKQRNLIIGAVLIFAGILFLASRSN